MKHAESKAKAHLLKEPPLHQKRRTLATKVPEGHKKAKREGGDRVIVRRSERLAAKLTALVDLQDHKQCS